MNDHVHALPVGYQLEEYQIAEMLGAGGFGITYKAYDNNLKRWVAIKEYLPNDFAVRDRNSTVKAKSSADQGAYQWGLERFLQEAQILSQFKHPNIVQVLRLFQAHNTAYIVMEYEEGLSLANSLEQKKLGQRMDEKLLLQILLPLLEGLSAVHEGGILHRDIKPGNIYLRRRDHSPVLLDFGAARQAVGRKSRSVTALITPGYSPFEQYSSDTGRQGPWTDIYALGAVAYRLISDQMPPDAPDRMGQDDGLVPAAKIGKGRYAPHLLQAVDHALAVMAKDRPQTVAAWRAELLGEGKPAPTVAALPKLALPRFNWVYLVKYLKYPLGVLGLMGVIWAADVIYQQRAELEPVPPVAAGKTLTDTVNWVDFEFVPIPAGSFKMGSNNGESDEQPPHEVSLSGFYLGKTEITQGQWQAVMGSNPSHFSACGATCPVEQVSWEDVQDFIGKLKAKTGKTYRLPTEAEWEYAARSGGQAQTYAGGENLDALAWYDGNSGNKTHPVAQKQRNGLGLYDMSGNVWEWVQDWYDSSYYRNSPEDNPLGPDRGSSRVYRGGCWSSDAWYLRSANRSSSSPDYRDNLLGFRLVRRP